MSGHCKKTYQGHVNTKYSLGGAFGVGGTEGFIVSGSEEGDILFWDVQNKNVIQRVTGHDGVVCWVDTCPGASGTIASGGLDGTVRIWVDVPDEDGIDRLKLEDEVGENGYTSVDDVGMDRRKVQNGDDRYDDDTPRDDMSIDGERNSEREAETLHPDGMDED